MARPLALLCLLTLFTGCGFTSPESTPSSPEISRQSEEKAKLMATTLRDPYWQKRWWLEKTVRVMRGGRGLLPNEDVEALMKLSEEEILAKLLQDPRFGNMALDFNLFFLGFKPDSVRIENPGDAAYDFPAAISSAKAVLENGDYFTLFDLNHPFHLSPLMLYSRTDEEKGIPEDELLRIRGARFVADLDAILLFAKTDPTATVANVCQKGLEHFRSSYILSLSSFTLSITLQISDGWYGHLFNLCQKPELRTVPELVESLEKIQGINRKLAAALPAFAANIYKPQSALGIQALEMPEGILSKGWISYGVNQRFGLLNSSTNLNRKRSAYMLKRYFCDDLNPVGVENPKEHTGGKHGSQTSCYSCHYKLDPMAGFFRNYGIIFTDFTGRKEIVFDDQAKVELATYLVNWKNPAGSSREWNVGYIRSIKQEEQNDYGDSLADLHALLRRAPEVKRCVVKRLFQYMNSDDQTIDGGYLDYLSEQLTIRGKENSSEAFRWVVGQIALGQTFRNPDPVPTDCYDYKPGHQPGNSPPCRVAHILQKNCTSCHSSVYGSGNLDLSGWMAGPDGKKTFPHEEKGEQLPLHTTLEKISHRLSASDPALRMPLLRDMPSQERQELYLWAQEQLSQKKRIK